MRVILSTILLLAVGCKSASAPPPTSKTPANIAAVVEDIGRAQVELKAALPLITEPIPKTHVEAAVGHLTEATTDGGEAFKQAEKEGKTIAAQAERIRQLESADPLKAILRWTSYVLFALSVGFGLAAFFLPLLKARLLTGSAIAFAAGAVFAGLAYWVKTIALVFVLSIGVPALILAVWFGVHLILYHRCNQRNQRNQILRL